MYCTEPEKIENFEKAKADNFKGWEVHHRLETHNSDGERRVVDITRAELKALGMYYDRPPEELIYLTGSEHTKLHNERKKNFLGKRHSSETKNKISASMRGENNHFYGKKHSDESKKKISATMKSLYWFNNGEINIRAKECPPGFIPGRFKNN